MDSTSLSTIAVSIIMLSLSGCGNNTNTDDNGGSVTYTGTLSLNLTDASIDTANAVVVKFDAVEIKPKQDPSFQINFTQQQSIDLYQLQNGESVPLLQSYSLPAGEYNWIRLAVDADQNEMDSYISFDNGSTYSLYIPSGSQTGLKFNRNFTVPVGGVISFMIDFDLRKSILPPSGQATDYRLNPSLRIENLNETGNIAGYILANTVNSSDCATGLALYLYKGINAATDDEGSPTPPVTSSIPVYDNVNDRYHYKISYIPEGQYTVAVTCDAENDGPVTDESVMDWSSLIQKNIDVVTNNTVLLNF